MPAPLTTPQHRLGSPEGRSGAPLFRSAGHRQSAPRTAHFMAQSSSIQPAHRTAVQIGESARCSDPFASTTIATTTATAIAIAAIPDAKAGQWTLDSSFCVEERAASLNRKWHSQGWELTGGTGSLRPATKNSRRATVQ